MLTAVLALFAALLLPLASPVHADGPLVGGATRAEAVPLSLSDLDGSFLASNADKSSDRGLYGYWANLSWYSFTPDRDVRLQVRATSVDPVGWDNTLEIWGPTRAIVQNDDYYGYDAFVLADLQGGSEYYLGLGGYAPYARGTATVTLSTTVPGPVRGLVATPGNATIGVHFQEPLVTGTGITQYSVYCTPEGQPETLCRTWTGFPPVTVGSVPATNGVPTVLRVVAHNSLGAGTSSDPVGPVTPKALSSSAVSTDPGSPVSGEPFAVHVDVSAASSVDGGTVDVTVGSDVHTGLPVVDGRASVPAVVAPAGPLPVTAHFSGTALVAESEVTASVVVGRRGQTVAFDPVGPLVFAGTVPVGTTTSSGLPVVLTAAGACEVDGDEVTGTDVGDCTVTATQAGDSEHEPASVSTTLTVGQRPQTVTLAVPDPVFGLGPVTVAGTSDVGLPVALSATGACSLDGDELTPLGVGECVVVATADGDAHTLLGSAVHRVEVTAVPAVVHSTISAELGALAGGSTVSAIGTGLLPGSELRLEAHSTPQLLGTAVVAADGTAVVTGVLPVLPVGGHHLVAVGTAADGTPAVYRLPFAVTLTGVLAAVGDRSLPEPPPVVQAVAASPLPAAAAPRAATLPRTGAEPQLLVLAAGMLLLTGTVLLRTRRGATRR